MKRISKFICLVMSILLLSTPVFASSQNLGATNVGNIKITKVSENSLLVKEAGSESLITVNENIESKRVDIIAKGKEEYFIVDKNAKNLYSSITNKTIDISEFEEENEFELLAKNGTYSRTVRVSFKAIADGVSGAISVATVVGFIMAAIYAPYALEGVAAISDFVSLSWDLISSNITSRVSGVFLFIYINTLKLFTNKEGNILSIKNMFIQLVDSLNFYKVND